MFRLLLVLSLFVCVQGTQLSELPEQFLGLISNEIKQFYSNLTVEERAIIDIVDENTSNSTNYANVYKKFNKALGERADLYVNKEAAKILKLESTARNFYLQILQLPNQLKLIGGGKPADWERMAKELLVQFKELSTEAKSSLNDQYPEVMATLISDNFRKFAGFSTDESEKETPN